MHGIDIDRDQHPITARGVADRRIWVLGPLCEGATFYNNLVPSPNMRSRPVFDAHRCVAAILGRLDSGNGFPQAGAEPLVRGVTPVA